MTAETVTHSVDQWADRIRGHLAQSVEGFINAGRELAEAKQDIPHGGWEDFVRDRVGITPRSAQMLMALAGHEAIANPKHVSLLPPSWGTLYQLAQLEAPALEQAIAAGEVTPDLERDKAKDLVKRWKQATATTRFEVLEGDFRQRLRAVPDSSVDAVITDPPYPAEYLPLYGDLSDLAARVLKPGGICAVMAGQSYLPGLMELLGRGLRYHWTLAYLTPGGQSAQLWQRKVNTFWKPVLVYTNGDYAGPWFGDVTKSNTNDNDKRHHHWGQSESGMADLVERLTQARQTVLDPFMGAGTTGVVALTLGRSFIGCDDQTENVVTARERLEAIQR